MKIIVTGGAGFIGSHLVRHLLELGHEIWNLDKLTYAGNLESLADVENHPRYHFLKLDICDGEAIHSVFHDCQPDAVMHLAAESHVDRSISGPAEFMRTNILGTYTLLEAARGYFSSRTSDACPPTSSSAFRFLHVSTDEVYGSLGETGEFTETTAYNPRSPYSASKAASDHLVRAWHHTYGLPVIVTNGANNYGPYQFPEKLIPVVLLKALRGESIPVYGTGKNIRDWIHVEDHAEALIRVLEAGSPGETYNIGGNDEIRNIDLVTLLCSILDEIRPRADGRSYTGQITFVADRPGHDLRYAVNASKIRDQLGWRPRRDHESGFRATVEWYLNNEAWWRNILNGSYQLVRLGKA